MWEWLPITWIQRYQLRRYLRGSLWVWPLLGIPLAIVLVRSIHWVEDSRRWHSNVPPEAARLILVTMASCMFSFIVFVCSALLLAVQLASAQLTPRIIAFLFRDNAIKVVLSLSVFIFTFTMAVLVRINDTVPMLTTYIAGYSCLANVAIFLYLVDHMGGALRANGALRAVGTMGRQVVDAVYPRVDESFRPSPTPEQVLTSEPTQIIPSHKDGVVLAFAAERLLALAKRYDCIVEIVPQVGDFVAKGDSLFRIFKGAANVPARALYHSIAIGRERTFEQDPAFALRVIVDIANRALSPAINDPTTAVLALDEIHQLLRTIGKRHLDDRVLSDSHGNFRLAYRTPGWSDFVTLGVTEIRHYGSQSIQIARRMRALLEGLIRSLPQRRAVPLQNELELLRRSAQRVFAEPEDQALAGVSDTQGVGGRPESSELSGNGSHLAQSAKEEARP